MSDKKTGILLLSHGSRLDDGEEVIKAYKEMYAEEFPEMPWNTDLWKSENQESQKLLKN